MANEVIGIAGCGATGEPISQLLLAAGFEVWIHDVDRCLNSVLLLHTW